MTDHAAPGLTVLHVVEAVETGIVRHVTDVVEHVDAIHHVALPEHRVGGMTDTAGVARLGDLATLHHIAMRRSPASPQNLASIVRVRRLIASLQPGVVHGHSTIGGAVARIACVGSPVPAIYTPNGLSPMRSARLLERALARFTARFVAVSRSELDRALAHGAVRPDRSVVIPNGISDSIPTVDGPSLRERLGLDADDVLIGTVGRITEQKAPEVLIDAWHRIAAVRPSATFVWIGDGTDRATAEAAAAAGAAADRIVFTGVLDRAAGLVGELDLFMLASRYEGGPYAPIEAMRAGVPVVATDVTGTRDVVCDGVTGRLVSAESPAALADAAIELLTQPDQLRRLAEGGRAFVADELSVHRMGATLRDLYTSVQAG